MFWVGWVWDLPPKMAAQDKHTNSRLELVDVSVKLTNGTVKAFAHAHRFVF